MSLKERVLQKLEENRERVLSGKVNCIPSPFDRFRTDFVGIKKGCYYLISGGAKSGKTKITSLLFVYSPLLYAYEHPDQVKVKIFYYALEETKEEIMTKFMSYLLYTLSEGKIRITPSDLESTNADKIVSQEILDLLKSDKYNKLLDYFEEHVIFGSSANPTGIWLDMTKYAEMNGVIHYKDITIVDKNTGELKKIKAFDYYEPADPDEYVMILVDHVSLLNPEKGMTTRETINKLSEYLISLRNKYNYIPVVVQQQSSETMNLDAFRANKIKPTLSGLGDSKYTGRDCSLFLGISNPYAHEYQNYYGYDITKLKDNFRLLEVVLSRIGPSNGAVGLYFDGVTGFIKELPPPKDTESLEKIYKYINKIKQQ